MHLLNPAYVAYGLKGLDEIRARAGLLRRKSAARLGSLGTSMWTTSSARSSATFRRW